MLATMKIRFLTAAALVAASAAAAQTKAGFVKISDALENRAIFAVEFEDGTSAYVNERTLVSISRQDYVAGPLEVSEIVIETTGNTQIRIYRAAPVSPEKLARKGAAKLSGIPGEMAQEALNQAEAMSPNLPPELQIEAGSTIVYKDYPATTHAKTAEFAVEKREDIDALYELLITDYALEKPAPGALTKLGGNKYAYTSPGQTPHQKPAKAAKRYF